MNCYPRQSETAVSIGGLTVSTSTSVVVVKDSFYVLFLQFYGVNINTLNFSRCKINQNIWNSQVFTYKTKTFDELLTLLHNKQRIKPLQNIKNIESATHITIDRTFDVQITTKFIL